MNTLRIDKILNPRAITPLLMLITLTGCTLLTPGGTVPPATTTPLTATPALPTGEIPAGGGDQTAERIEFEPGTSEATINGTLSADSEINYALAASAGQNVTVAVVSDAAPVNFTVFGPGGTSWSGEAQTDTDNRMEIQFAAPESGDYLVTLPAAADGMETSYEATFIVDPSAVVRISFPAGESVVERSGSLPTDEASQQFLLSGNVGWTMTVDAASDATPLSMTIDAPSGMQWIPEMQPSDNGYTIGQ